jgi:peptide alpha-N-acetyltransferase
VDKASANPNPKFEQVLKANLTLIPETKDLKFYNNGYLARHKDCARKTQAALKLEQLLNPKAQAQNEKELIATLDQADLKEAQEGLEILKSWKSEDGVREEYVEKARGKWPEAAKLFTV